MKEHIKNILFNKKVLVFSLLFIFLAVSFCSIFILVSVSMAGPTGFCGDGLTQSPNATGKYEKCDDGNGTSPKETDRCTTECGEKMLGWAWASVNGGWISLNAKNCNYYEGMDCSSSDYFVQVDAQNKIRGWGWSENIGWVCFGENCSSLDSTWGTVAPSGGWKSDIDPDDPNPTMTAVTGWGKVVALKDEGLLSFSCKNVAGACPATGVDPYPQLYLVKSNFTKVSDGTTESRYSLKGFSYNNNDNNVGVGWIAFSPDMAPVKPWIQTQYGDIYSQKGLVASSSPAATYNATYRILSNGNIEGFASAQSNQALWVIQGVGQINFPKAETRYSNALGSLDIDSITCNFNGQSTCVNRYGTTVVNLALIPFTAIGGHNLGGKIYYYNGDLTINSSVLNKFNNGLNYDSGAGTIVINGNLTINNDITYEDSNSPNIKFKNLAVAAWIIKGDLKINPVVKTLAGNFVIIGNGSECDSNTVGCGQIFSCDTLNVGDCSTNGLLVNGLVIARKFNFARTYLSSNRPAESIIYDGRLLANTPPGLGDFAKALPVWRSNVSN